MAVTFTIAQISDPHIAAMPYKTSLLDGWGNWRLPKIRLGIYSSHNPDMLEGVARYIYYHQDELDAVLLSGDLSTSGFYPDLTAAAEFVELPAADTWLTSDGRPTLEFFTKPKILFPGNHDRYSDDLFGAGSRMFHAVFQNHWHPNAYEGQDTVLKKGGEELAVVCSDLCLDSANDDSLPLGFFGQGRAYPSVTNDLRTRTNTHQAERAAVWSIHFPPEFPGISRMLELIDDYLLIDAASRCAEKIHLFTGHTHQPIPPYFAGATERLTVHCAGTACQCISSFGQYFHILRITVDKKHVIDVSRDHWKWNPAQTVLDF